MIFINRAYLTFYLEKYPFPQTDVKLSFYNKFLTVLRKFFLIPISFKLCTNFLSLNSFRLIKICKRRHFSLRSLSTLWNPSSIFPNEAMISTNKDRAKNIYVSVIQLQMAMSSLIPMRFSTVRKLSLTLHY